MALLAMQKQRKDDTVHDLPLAGGKLCVPRESLDGREAFTLDLTRGRINIHRGTYQHRARNTVVLARLDFGGAPHRNPDDEEVGVPHLHLYREGYGDRWAEPVPAEHFGRLEDRWQTLLDFMRFCSIVRAPEFNPDLFA